MLKVNIVCVGTIKEKFFTDAISEYSKRLSKFCKLQIVEVAEESKEQNVEKKIEIESERLKNACRGFIILLDRCKQEVSSEELSNMLDTLKSAGTSEVSFVIGGSNGVSEEFKRQANKCVSFGKITFPHQLFRVVLLEQIYRALTISAGLPYHK